MSYLPQPIDTSAVVLDENINELLEFLAKNTHDVWAKQRITEGWTYGEHRDDINKKHPCLIPYENLTEDEKQYDRNTALETLKLIITLGYNISK